MPELKMTFMNLALVAHNTTSSRLLTVAHEHTAELSTDKGFKRELNGEVITIGIKGGADLAGRSLRPLGKRLVHFDWIVDTTVTLKPDATLAALVNADVRLPAGRWIEDEPEIRIAELEVFRDEIWEFKDANAGVRHRQQLTNVVHHVTPLEARVTYELRIGGVAVEEFPGDADKVITIENFDTAAVPPWDRVIRDFELMYPLLTSPASGFVEVHQTSGVNPPQASFTRPICPNAQIG